MEPQADSKNTKEAGKGSKPRPIKKSYWKNFDKIKGFKKAKYK